MEAFRIPEGNNLSATKPSLSSKYYTSFSICWSLHQLVF